MKPSELPHTVLHITYFVDPKRKRHLQISIKRLQLAVICGTAAAVGTFAGLLWLFSHQVSETSSLNWLEQISASLHQAPESTASLAAATGASAGLESATMGDREETSVAGLPSSGRVTGRRLASVEAKTVSNTINITSPEFQYASDGLHAKFSIVNHGPKTAHGTVWGTAIFETDRGEIISVGSHTELDLSAFEDMRHIEQGTPFKARNLTNKTLTFKFPEDKRGRFKEVRLAAGERNRAQLIVATYALD